MGKKGNWFSALKRALTSSPRNKSSEKKKEKEAKSWNLGRQKNGEANSFIPLYRQPSSIEKILGDTEREQQHIIGDAEREQHHKVLGDAEREQPHKLQQVRSNKAQRLKTPTLKQVVTQNRAQISATKIQAAYKGYTARKSYRALKGLVRLQGVMRGKSVKRQAANAMRCMQLLVRVQSQIRARRLHMMESRSHQQHKITDREAESSLSKWSFSHQSEAESHEEWEDSVLTKEKIDERMQRKVEAVIKRERALAYAYSHQLLKVTPKSAHGLISGIQSGSGQPWWWSWLDRRPPPPQTPPPAASVRPISGHFKPGTPRSSKPMPSPSPKQRWQLPRDDDYESLTSCPAYTVPRYMATTASSKAKLRVHGEGERRDGKRRFTFGLGTSIGSMMWGKGGSLFAAERESGTPRAAAAAARHRPSQSIGRLSVDSTVSLPVGVGRKTFR